MTLYAPYDGIVTEQNGERGDVVKAGMELFKFSDISKIWVYADIYEYELPWVKVGQEAAVDLPYADQQELTGKLSYVYPYVEPKTRTVKVRIELPEPGIPAEARLYVNVQLKTQQSEECPWSFRATRCSIPGTSSTVFVALGNGKFEPRQVKVGMEGNDGIVQVKQGLFEGEEVVTSAQFMLDSESQLREAIQKMREPRQAAARAKAEATAAPAPDGGKGDKKENLNDLF